MASNFEFMNLPLQIKPTFKGPIEKDVKFDSLADANTWLSSAYAYEGAAVRIKEEGTWVLYLVQNRDNTLVFEPVKGGSGGGTYDGVFDDVDPLEVVSTDSDTIIAKLNELIGHVNTENPAAHIEYLGGSTNPDGTPVYEDDVTIQMIYDKVNELINELKHPSKLGGDENESND